ncbi:MAG: exosortase-associated EpsI family protein [Phycisphaerales bacterium]|nr:exosortase-associated EpsI family protein [Phycisphaerales bacterium]
MIALIVIGAMRVNPGDALEIEAYHERIARVVDEIPIDINGWVGRQVELPQSAINLLRPNAILARQYLNKEKRALATLMIVQCKDTRDMAGHYPPVCYPSNGWLKKNDDLDQRVIIDDQTIKVYEFHRVAGRVERDITIYSLFALPTGELTTSMTEVRQLSANHELRKYGAAQIQVLIDGDTDPKDHLWILEDMFEIARPVIEAVLDASPQQAQNRGGES